MSENLSEVCQSKEIAKLVTALAKVQGELRGYREDSSNPFFQSKYGDLSSVWAAIRTLLSDNGLAVMQPCVDDGKADGFIRVKTILAHSSGEWISGTLALRPVKPDPQAAGSAITYARRYSLAAIVGVAPEDDDAEGAMNRRSEREEAQERIRKTAQKEAQRKADEQSPPQQPSDVIDKAKDYDPDEYITYPVDEFKRETGKAVCLSMFGNDVWIAKSQIHGNYRPPLSEVCVTKWVAGEKGLPLPEDDVPF